MTLAGRLADHVERSPDREVITFRDLSSGVESTVRYQDLWANGHRIAEALEARAKRPRTLIVLPLSADVLFAHVGTSLAGGVPAIHSHPSSKMPEEAYVRHLAHVLEMGQPDVVLTNKKFSAALEQAGSTHPRIAIEDLPAHASREVSAWKDVMAEEVAVLQHSSGSTGLQKSVALTHAMVIEQCRAYARSIAVDPEKDRICSWIPLYHDMGLFTTWLLPVLEGIRVSAIDPFSWVQSPAAFLRLIHDHRGTLSWQPNFAYNLLAVRVRDEEVQGVDLSSMRGWSNCSEPVRASSHRAFLDRFARFGVRSEALWVCYAMAENSFAVTQAGGAMPPPVILRVDRERFAEGSIVCRGEGLEVVSVGAPIEGCGVRVVDGDRVEVADDRIGEIAIGSPYTLVEYFRNPEATAAAINQEGWYHSGDLGFVHEGQLFITGRKKDLLIVGGRNFYPQDIEAIVDGCESAVPGRSVAIGVDDEKTGTQRVIVLAETRSTKEKDQRILEAAIRRRVFEELDCALGEVHAVPHGWLLKTTSGKIARQPNLQRLRQQYPLDGTFDQDPAVRGSMGGLAISVAVGFLVALAVYVMLVLQPNLSWGIYAGF